MHNPYPKEGVSAYSNKEGLSQTGDLLVNRDFINEIAFVTPDLITIFDVVSNKVIFANYENSFQNEQSNDDNFSVPDIVGMNLHIYPGDRKKAKEYIEKRYSLADSEMIEIELRNKFENEWGWIKIRSKVFKRNAQGKAIQIISFVTNITEKKKIAEEIKEKAYFIQQITDKIPDILIVYDIPEDKIVYVNRGLFLTLGYYPEEFYSSKPIKYENFLHPDDYQKRLAQMHVMHTLKPDEVRETELRIKDAAGKWRWFKVRDTFFKANEDGSLKQILNINQEITAEKEAEEAYLKEKLINDELKRINELMDTFVFSAAHDLKAPISNLRLLTNVIDCAEETEKKLKLQNKYSQIIERLDKTITGLIQVLALEKDSTSDLKKLKFLDIYNTVSKELTENIYVVNPNIHIDFSGYPSIFYIESYLVSIFRNLFTNALKYRSEERKLNIRIKTQRWGKGALLTFSDNGIGIDLSLFSDDLFKPFKRFSSQSSGSGIGLYLMKSMVRKNGGNIEIESYPGMGTTFKIHLLGYN